MMGSFLKMVGRATQNHFVQKGVTDLVSNEAEHQMYGQQGILSQALFGASTKNNVHHNVDKMVQSSTNYFQSGGLSNKMSDL